MNGHHTEDGMRRQDDARHTIYRSNAVSRVEPADTSLDADQQPVES